MAKTIRYAVGKFEPEIREVIIRAWNATGCMDLYDGDLESYIKVIAQTLEERNRRISKMVVIIDSAIETLDRG